MCALLRVCWGVIKRCVFGLASSLSIQQFTRNNGNVSGAIERLQWVLQVKGQEITLPIPRMTYADAMARYGCDKPDTRYGLELHDVSDAVAGCTFK